jgi:thymidylate synthase
MRLADKRDLFAFDYDDFQLEGYRAHPKIEAPIAV